MSVRVVSVFGVQSLSSNSAMPSIPAKRTGWLDQQVRLRKPVEYLAHQHSSNLVRLHSLFGGVTMTQLVLTTFFLN